MVEVVRVCTVTLGKRLREFGRTSASRMTVEEFDSSEPSQVEESNPPSFMKNRREEKRRKMEEGVSEAEAEEMVMSDEVN